MNMLHESHGYDRKDNKQPRKSLTLQLGSDLMSPYNNKTFNSCNFTLPQLYQQQQRRALQSHSVSQSLTVFSYLS